MPILIISEKGYNEVCSQDLECMGPDLVCRSSMCQCTPDKMYDGMMCVASKHSLLLVSTTLTSMDFSHLLIIFANNLAS